MALFNESLEGRWNQLIQRLHGHKGHPPAPQISPEIGHEIVLENDRPENYYLAQSDLWAGQRNLAANATHVGIVGIRNPVNSGVLVVVTGIQIANAALVAALVDLAVRNNTLASAASVQSVAFRDGRRGWGKFPSVLLILDNTSFLTQAAYGFNNITEEVQLAAGQGDTLLSSPPYILPPGTEIALMTAVVNQALDADFSGYVRPLHAMDLLG